MTRVSPEPVYARVLRAIQPYAQVELTPDANLREAGMSSLDMMCALNSVQDEFSVNFSDDQFHAIQTVRDITALFDTAPKAA